MRKDISPKPVKPITIFFPTEEVNIADQFMFKVFVVNVPGGKTLVVFLLRTSGQVLLNPCKNSAAASKNIRKKIIPF